MLSTAISLRCRYSGLRGMGWVGAGGDSANVCERKSKGGLGSFGKLKVPFENVEAGAHVGAQVAGRTYQDRKNAGRLGPTTEGPGSAQEKGPTQELTYCRPPHWKNQLWPRDSNETASGKLGAFQFALRAARPGRASSGAVDHTPVAP